MNPIPTGVPFGTIAAIRRYPVKSMAGEALAAADLHRTWMHGDRQYAFVKASDTSDFPWLTGRDVPDLVRHRAHYAGGGDPKRARVVVEDPDGVEHDIRDTVLARRLTEAAGAPVWLLRLGRGAFDAMPVSVITTTTAEAISQAHGAAVALDRFRSNIVIQPDEPVSEHDWLGRRLVFGDRDGAPSLGADWLIPRCAMVGIDPVTATRDASIVRTVVQRFGNQVGVYCSVHTPGTVRVGDRVRLAA